MDYDIGAQCAGELLAMLSRQKIIEIQDMIVSFGGRLSLIEVQAMADVDMLYVNTIVQKSEDFQIVGGDVLHKLYLTGLADEVRRELHTVGFITIGNLSLKFQLPLELVTATVKSHLCGNGDTDVVIKNSTLYSQQYLEQQKSTLRGACLATVKPLVLSQLAASVPGLDEAWVLQYLSKLCKEEGRGSDGGGGLTGTCSGREYIPLVFRDKQRRQVDAHFCTNGLIELTALSRYQVLTRPLEYLQISFPDAILLDTCIISENICALFLAELRELAMVQPTDSSQASASWDGSGGIPWLRLADSLPPALTDADVACMWKLVQQQSNSTVVTSLTAAERGSVMLVEADDGLYLFNKHFTAWLIKQFDGDAQSMGEILTAELKARVASKAALSISSNASVSATSMGLGSAAADDDWEDDGPPAKGGKKRNTTIKGKKVSKKSVRTASNKTDSGGGGGSGAGAEAVSVDALVAPYTSEARQMRLVREWCEELLAFASAKAVDDDDADDELTPMLEALLRTLREDILIFYKSAGNRAKVEASQGGLTSRMKKEEERDKKFDVMWTELYVVCKGLAALEDRKVDDAPDSSLAATAALHRCLLATRCARIAELLTAFACWENGLSLECQDAADGLAVGGVVCLDDEAAGECPVVAANPSTDSFNSTKVRPVLSADEKQRLMTALPKATGKVVKNLWSLVAAGRQSVWDFLDFLETCSSTGQLQLVCHKPDKKKEKAIAFAMKQKLMDRLRPCATAASALPLVLAMSVQQCSGSVLEISDDHLVTTYMEALAHIMAYLQQHLTMVDYMRVDRLKRFALGEELEVAELEDGEVQEDISEAAALEAAKSVVLKSNK